MLGIPLHECHCVLSDTPVGRRQLYPENHDILTLLLIPFRLDSYGAVTVNGSDELYRLCHA
jgi:hypothetical protein